MQCTNPFYCNANAIFLPLHSANAIHNTNAINALC